MTDATRIINISFLCFLSFASFLAGIFLISDHTLKQNGRRTLIFIDFFTGFLLFFDTLAYFYRGNTSATGWYMVRLSNFCVFVCNFSAVFFFCFYVCEFIKQSHLHFSLILHPKTSIRNGIPIQLFIVLCFSSIGILLTAANQFTPIFYYFDEQNIYHRGIFYPVSVALGLLPGLITLTMLIQNRKKLKKNVFTSLVVYCIFPFIGVTMISLIYGFSWINISLGIGALHLFFSSLKLMELEFYSIKRDIPVLNPVYKPVDSIPETSEKVVRKHFWQTISACTAGILVILVTVSIAGISLPEKTVIIEKPYSENNSSEPVCILFKQNSEKHWIDGNTPDRTGAQYDGVIFNNMKNTVVTDWKISIFVPYGCSIDPGAWNGAFSLDDEKLNVKKPHENDKENIHGAQFYTVPPLRTLGFGCIMYAPHDYSPLSQEIIFTYSSIVKPLTNILFDIFLTLLVIVFIISTTISVTEQKLIHAEEENKKLEETVKIATEQANRANKAKDNFLSSMSHEIRTPINAVLGLDEMILRECADKTIRGYAQDIQSSGKSLLSIVNDILDFSKIEAGKMEIIPVDYDLSVMISDLMNMISVKAETKGLQFIVNVDERTPQNLHGDDTRIKQCILNILTNAVKYTPAGSVTMNIGFENSSRNKIILKVQVIDTGIGIKAEDLQKLFSPFERIEEKRNRAIEGTGLGMSIVQNLLTAMGSRLEVQSEYGNGSNFSFAVEQEVTDWKPIGNYAQAKANRAEAAASYTESFQAPNAKVLIVDDTPMNLTVMKGLLKQTRIQIDTAQDGIRGLEKARAEKYDLIFIDHLMPKMDGLEMLSTLNKDGGKSAGMPCIVLTANAISGAKEMYLAAGFSDYLSKPVDSAKLEALLQSYLPRDKVLHKGDTGFAEKAILHRSVSQNDDRIAGDPVFLSVFGLDSNAALKNCGSVDTMLQAVQDFYNAIEEKSSQIERYAKTNDWKNYTILVHALKSSAWLIGAASLRDCARELEALGDKAQDGDASAQARIIQQTPILIAGYRAYSKKLSPLCSAETETQLPSISEEKLTEAFSALSESVTAFDFDTADAIIAELADYKIPVPFSKQYDQITAAIRAVDRERTLELLTDFH